MNLTMNNENNTGTYCVALFVALVAVCDLSFAANDCVFSDSFQCEPDREGPVIQIAPPSDWLQSPQIEVTYEDSSGLATRAFDSRPGLPLGDPARLAPFIESSTIAVESHWVGNFNALLGEGLEVLFFAQDVFGNFSRQSETLQLESPIRPGTYQITPMFESAEFSATSCPLGNVEPGSLRVRIESVGVNLSYDNSYCSEDEPLCMSFYSGQLLGTSTYDGSEMQLSSLSSDSGITDLSVASHETPIKLTASSSGGGDSYSIGSSVAATFNGAEPATLAAEFTAYCFTQKFEDPATGCPINKYDSCDVDTFGPFTVEGTLQN